MATVVATPVLAYTAALTGSGAGNSVSVTFSINNTGGWYVDVPVQIQFPTNVSAGPEIYAYRSTDGGANFETITPAALVIVRQSGGTARQTIRLDPGMYAVRVLVGGGSTATWSAGILTQQVVTAMIQV